MKKLVLQWVSICLLSLMYSSASFAQISVGLSGSMAFPNGDMASKDKMDVKSGYGVHLHGRYALNDNLAIGLNVGYYSFTINDVSAGTNASLTTASIYMMPVSLCAEYAFLTDDFKPYAGIDIGMINNSAKASGDVSGNTYELTGSKSGLYFAPVIGFNYAVSDAFDLNFHAKYNYGLTSGSMNITRKVNSVSTDDKMDWYNSTFISLHLGIAYKINN